MSYLPKKQCWSWVLPSLCTVQAKRLRLDTDSSGNIAFGSLVVLCSFYVVFGSGPYPEVIRDYTQLGALDLFMAVFERTCGYWGSCLPFELFPWSLVYMIIFEMDTALSKQQIVCPSRCLPITVYICKLWIMGRGKMFLEFRNNYY